MHTSGILVIGARSYADNALRGTKYRNRIWDIENVSYSPKHAGCRGLLEK